MNFNSLVQFATRDNISSAESIQKQTRQSDKLRQQCLTTLHHRVSNIVFLDDIRNSIFCYDIIKKILERYVLEDCLSSFTNPILGSVCFE